MRMRILAVWLSLYMCFWLSVGAGAKLPDNPAPTPAGNILPQTVVLPGAGGGNNTSSKVSDSKSKASGTKASSSSGTNSNGSSAASKLGNYVGVKLNDAGVQRTLRVWRTAVEDEYLLCAQDAAVGDIFKAHGASMSWDVREGLKIKVNGSTHKVAPGQRLLPAAVGRRELDVPCQVCDGVLYFPASLLEDFLEVHVTINLDEKAASIDGLLQSVSLEGSGSSQNLVFEANTPMKFSAFRLSQPARYVIDITDVVVNTESNRVAHPQLGVIRLAQFSILPAVVRVVVPLADGVKVTPPSNQKCKTLRFKIAVPNSVKASAARYSLQRLLDCTTEVRDKKQFIKLNFSGPVQYESMRLASPDCRFLLDFPNVVLAGKKRDIKLKYDSLDSVRISQHSNQPSAVARLVLDLKKPYAVSVSPGSDGHSLLIAVGDKTVASNKNVVKNSGYSDSSATGGAPPTSSTYASSSSWGNTFASGSSSAGAGSINNASAVLTNPNDNLKVLVLDPGHGGNDSGAVNRSLNVAEEDVTLDVCLRLAMLMRRNGWKVITTREDDRDVSYAGSSDSEELWARANVANENNADVFVSVHCNAAANSAAEGTSIHVYKTGDRALGETMIGPLISHMGRKNRGVIQDRFFVLAHTYMPAVLVETAFISNTHEASLLNSPEYRQTIAEGLQEGLNAYAAQYLQGRANATYNEAQLTAKPAKQTYLSAPSKETTIGPKKSGGTNSGVSAPKPSNALDPRSASSWDASYRALDKSYKGRKAAHNHGF